MEEVFERARIGEARREVTTKFFGKKIQKMVRKL